jgi:hypothetical protein
LAVSTDDVGRDGTGCLIGTGAGWRGYLQVAILRPHFLFFFAAFGFWPLRPLRADEAVIVSDLSKTRVCGADRSEAPRYR